MLKGLKEQEIELKDQMTEDEMVMIWERCL